MKFHGVSVLLCAGLLGSATAWVAPSPLRRSVMNRSYARGPTALRMAIDYNDPVVAEEFNNVQPMTYEEVEAELSDKGIPVSATMNEMDVKLMLVEMRLRFAGKLGGKKKERPAKFTSKLEEALWTKPVFEEFYNDLKTKGDNNALNVVTEYVQNKDIATQRYGKDYKALLRKVEAALTAPPPVNSPTLTFSGFPANMGEAGCRMTLESLGAVADFECAQDDDFPILRGTVTFEDIETAKKAVAQYDGMDMGMGNKLEMASV